MMKAQPRSFQRNTKSDLSFSDHLWFNFFLQILDAAIQAAERGEDVSPGDLPPLPGQGKQLSGLLIPFFMNASFIRSSC